MHEKANNGFNDPFRYLKEEHRAIVSLMDELAGKEGGRDVELSREALWKRIREALLAHVLLEDSTLYPMVSESPPTRVPAQRVHEGLADIARLLVELGAHASRTEEWADTFTMLRAQVERHVSEEERELLPLSRTALGEKGSALLMARMERHLSRAAA